MENVLKQENTIQYNAMRYNSSDREGNEVKGGTVRTPGIAGPGWEGGGGCEAAGKRGEGRTTHRNCRDSRTRKRFPIASEPRGNQLKGFKNFDRRSESGVLYEFARQRLRGDLSWFLNARKEAPEELLMLP